MTFGSSNKLLKRFVCIKILKGLPMPVAEINTLQETTLQSQSTKYKIDQKGRKYTKYHHTLSLPSC